MRPVGILTAEAPRKQELSGEAHLGFWHQHLRNPQFVYVIQGDPGTPIKIGTARDVRARMRGLQTGNPQLLRLLFVLPGGHGLERRLLDRRCGWYADGGGEWIIVNDETKDLLLLIEALAAHFVETYDGSGRVPVCPAFGDGDMYRQNFEVQPAVVPPSARRSGLFG